MKRIALITIVSISILLTGCEATQTTFQNAQTTTTSPVVTTQEPTTKATARTATTTLSAAAATTPSSTAETKKQSYSIATATFSKDNINIKYPQITGLADNSKEKTINDLIKNDVLNSQVETPIKTYPDAALTLDLKYQVTINTSELLSVVYTGYSNIEGSAHPTKDIHTITIDLKNATILKLSDFTPMDTSLAQKIKQSAAVTNDAVKSGMDKNELISAIQSMDNQTLIQGLKEEWAYSAFYVTPDSLVVSVPVAHAIGDYTLVELKGQYIKK